jgi:hypothetical protein
MSNLAEWLPNYKTQLGDFIDPHPTMDSLTADLPFVPAEQREGREFKVPVVVSLEQGQTADVTGDTFAINPARNSVMKEATVTGANLLYNARIPYDAMLRSRNGTGNGKSGGAFKDAFMLKTKMLMEQGEFYNEVAMHYGPGTGATIADDIGVIGTGGTGATLAGGVVVPITIATWAPGVWARMTNGLVDLYNAAGTTLIADNIVVNAVNPDYAPLASPPAPNITLQTTAATTTGGTTTPAALATVRIVVKGWAQKSCLGLVPQLKNQGLQFGINAAQYAVWKPKLVTVSSGTMTRLRMQSIGAAMFPYIGTGGMTFRASAPVFADMVEETDTFQQFTDSGEVRKVGANKLVYRSACGPITVKLDGMMKYGLMIGTGVDAKAVRTGASPLTFRGKGDEWFFTELQANAGSEIRCMANQAPFVHMPNRCVVVQGLTPNALI